MSAQGKQTREVQHAAGDGNIASGKRAGESRVFSSCGKRLVEIDGRAYAHPDLAVARFLISQGHLIEELVTIGVSGGSHE